MIKKQIHKCVDCSSRLTAEWQVLTEPELAIVDAAKRTRALEPGAILFRQGDDADGVYCMQSGLIGLRRVMQTGESVLLRLCTNGVTVGYRALLSKTPHRNSAEVLSPSVVCFIERTHVRRLLEANPKLGERFLQHCFGDLDETEGDHAKSMTLSLKARFLHLLLIFYERQGYRDETDNLFVDLPIQRVELASLIGARPESISRLVHSLEIDGLLHFDKRRVRIRDMDAVLRAAGVGF
ncbi:MAG: Crp/Fnr family transcriptional regulator [Hyphomicrobiaceae bacterium]